MTHIKQNFDLHEFPIIRGTIFFLGVHKMMVDISVSFVIAKKNALKILAKVKNSNHTPTGTSLHG